MILQERNTRSKNTETITIYSYKKKGKCSSRGKRHRKGYKSDRYGEAGEMDGVFGECVKYGGEKIVWVMKACSVLYCRKKVTAGLKKRGS